jgi:phospholipase/lecithinase/hemolysin
MAVGGNTAGYKYTTGDFIVTAGSNTYTLLGTGLNSLVPHTAYRISFVNGLDTVGMKYTDQSGTHSLSNLAGNWRLLLSLSQKLAVDNTDPNVGWRAPNFDTFIKSGSGSGSSAAVPSTTPWFLIIMIVVFILVIVGIIAFVVYKKKHK